MFEVTSINSRAWSWHQSLSASFIWVYRKHIRTHVCSQTTGICDAAGEAHSFSLSGILLESLWTCGAR